MTSPRNILITRTDRIGDVVLSLPIASTIKKYLPETKVSFLLKEYTSALAQNNKFIDDVLILNETNGKPLIWENVNRIKNRFDACIVAFPTFRIALILFLAGIKTRIGSGYRWYSFLFNKKIYEHRKFGERHELEFNVRLLQQIGIDETPTKDSVRFGLASSREAKMEIENEFHELAITGEKRIVIFHPGSGGSAIDLPVKKMRELIQKVSQELDCMVLITGSRTEEELCKSMVVNPNVINLAGKYKLDELIALINRSSILVANSTGPIHIAAALGKYVVGFYPKFAAVSPKRWGPYTERAKIFQPTVCQGECSREKCMQLNCMNSIEIEKVFSSIKEIL